MAQKNKKDTFDPFDAMPENKVIGDVKLREVHPNMNYNEDTSSWEMTTSDEIEVAVGPGAFEPSVVINLKKGDRSASYVVEVADLMTEAIRKFQEQLEL